MMNLNKAARQVKGARVRPGGPIPNLVDDPLGQAV